MVRNNRDCCAIVPDSPGQILAVGHKPVKNNLRVRAHIPTPIPEEVLPGIELLLWTEEAFGRKGLRIGIRLRVPEESPTQYNGQ